MTDILERLREYDENGATFHDAITEIESLRAVYQAAVVYRKHMLGEIEPVQACGMRLDVALTAVHDDLNAQ